MPEPIDHATYDRPLGLAWPAGGWPFETAAAIVCALAVPPANTERAHANDNTLAANIDPGGLNFKA